MKKLFALPVSLLMLMTCKVFSQDSNTEIIRSANDWVISGNDKVITANDMIKAGTSVPASEIGEPVSW